MTTRLTVSSRNLVLGRGPLPQADFLPPRVEQFDRVHTPPTPLQPRITIDSSNTGTDGTAADTNFFLTTADNRVRTAQPPLRRWRNALPEPSPGYLRLFRRLALRIAFASARAARSSARYTRTASGCDSFQTSGRRV